MALAPERLQDARGTSEPFAIRLNIGIHVAGELVAGTAPMVAYLFLGIFAVMTYLLGGIAREQVCTYMCPWPRIQAALTDEWALNNGFISVVPTQADMTAHSKLNELNYFENV